VTGSVIEVKDLEKHYGDQRVLKGITFDVRTSEIFSLLGANGAGKTTTLSIIEGLIPATGGSVKVFGLDIAKDPQRIKQRIGVQLQSTSLIPDLTAIEQVKLLARLYRRNIGDQKAMALLESVALQDKASALPAKMSGGQQQRLVLALALVNDPEIVFLDEPTAGLDPQSRRMLWDVIQNLRQDGATIVMTTHYMEEAETLSHRVGILDDGQLLALDTPGALINQFNGASSITLSGALPQEALLKIPSVQTVVRENELTRVYTHDVGATNTALVELAKHLGIELRDFHIRQPSLEDVFLSMTGKMLHES